MKRYVSMLCQPKWISVLFLLTIAFGVVLRFYLLNISFEYDELFTAVTANPFVPFSYIWTHYLRADVHPPLHNMLLWLYTHWVPYGPEWVLRLPSLLFGLGALAEGWFLFPRRFGRTARNLFIALLSCNFYLILYAQHARAYALILCAAVPFTFLYLNLARRIIHRKNISVKHWVAYGILALVLCWSHYFGALLFGLFSCILGFLAWQKKCNWRGLVLTFSLVMLGFLPWMIPNLLENISQQRFAGNWWGNKPLGWKVVILWIEFFFSSKSAFGVLLVLLTAALAQKVYGASSRKKWAYWRELGWCFWPCFLSLLFALIMSVKIYWLLWRYFIAFIPCLYLFTSLFLAPLCRKYKGACYGMLAVVILSYLSFFDYAAPLRGGALFTARGALEIYKEAFSDKELFVVAIEAFPPQSMTPMYGFYPHYYWGMNNRVTEVFHMSQEAFEEIVHHQQEGVFWMPNCDPGKMDLLVRTWNRRVGIFARYENTCFLLLSGEDRVTFDDALLEEYQTRFSQYASRRQRAGEKR